MSSFIADLHHVSLNVEDVERAEAFYVDGLCAHLAAHDVKVSGPKPVGAGRQAFFHDLDGNRLEVYQDN